jgi:hypothetical protein
MSEHQQPNIEILDPRCPVAVTESGELEPPVGSRRTIDCGGRAETSERRVLGRAGRRVIEERRRLG